MASSYRKTSQYLMPAVKPACKKGKYDIYPSFDIGQGKIFRGIESLAEKISGEKIVILDGFSGIFFENLRNDLDSVLKTVFNISANWVNSLGFVKSEDKINEMILPFLGGDDPLFGTRTHLSLADFFSPEKVQQFSIPAGPVHTIIYGTGASHLYDAGYLIYFDLPKNELQFRSRAGKIANLGASRSGDPKTMYKRYYFVDWVVLDKHKQEILERIDILADAQRMDDITWVSGTEFRESLNNMTQSAIRARPWFEPGTWGGSWMKEHIPGINPDVPNYAWSFELITPENGLIFESSGILLEFSFDFLMYKAAEAVLGDSYERFGTAFPVRFDFLDTFDGGNLSIQCHPRPEYMKENFGENFTQEETYYILDTKDNAGVYLGFQEDIDKEKFLTLLDESFKYNTSVDIEKFVQKHSSHKHDLFLIPYGTIHGSGKDNLVLEISSTPYIFTFKMYDWLRPDLDGKPRTLNIERGMDNLYFERKGDLVSRDLISKPLLIDKGPDWQLFHIPTHPTHLYDIIRYHFSDSVLVHTENKCHVLNLVEGNLIRIEIPGSRTTEFNFAETFIIPASVKNYRAVNLSGKPAKLVIAYIK
jgi:mannose-6-phosphate isomerase class I